MTQSILKRLSRAVGTQHHVVQAGNPLALSREYRLNASPVTLAAPAATHVLLGSGLLSAAVSSSVTQPDSDPNPERFDPVLSIRQ